MAYRLPIYLDSSTTNQPSHDFEIRLDRPILFENDVPHEIGLVSLSTYYSFFNIKAASQNNEFKYSSDGGETWKIIVVPDGNYSIWDWIDYIKFQINKLEDDEEAYDTNIYMRANTNTLRLEITLFNDYQIDFTHQRLYYILGYIQQILAAGVHVSENHVNITDDVQSLIIHCSVCDSMSYSNTGPSDRLFSFIPNTPPGSAININVETPYYCGISRNRIDSIRIKLTDQLNRPINLNGESLSLVLYLQPRQLLNKKLK